MCLSELAKSVYHRVLCIPVCADKGYCNTAIYARLLSSDNVDRCQQAPESLSVWL